MKKLACAVLAVAAMSGCYVGRSPGAKKVAYVGNGALVGVGLLGVTNTGGGDEQSLTRMIGAVPLVVGLLGIALNLAVETEQPAQPAGTPHRASGSAASITY